jgi:hypothetical protein
MAAGPTVNFCVIAVSHAGVAGGGTLIHSRRWSFISKIPDPIIVTLSADETVGQWCSRKRMVGQAGTGDLTNSSSIKKNQKSQ